MADNNDGVERCPQHPDVEPELVEVDRIRSHQADWPTRIVTQLRCPICG